MYAMHPANLIVLEKKNSIYVAIFLTMIAFCYV